MGDATAVRGTMGTLAPHRHIYWAGTVCLTLVLVLSIVEPLGVDEQLTRIRALGGLDEVWERNAYGYFAVVHLWSKIFGASTLALRVPSVIAVLAALPMLWHAARRLYGVDVANASVWLLALHPFTLRYGSEARGYAFVLLASAAAGVLLARAWQEDTRERWALFGLVVAAGMWAHLTAGWLLPIALARVRSPRFLWGWATAAVGFLPMAIELVLLRAQGSLLAWTDDYTLGWIFSHSVWWMAGLFAVPAVAVLLVRGADRMLAWWMLVPLLGATFVHWLGEPLLWPRMVIVTAPAVALAAGRGFDRTAWRVPVAAVAGVGWALSYVHVFGRATSLS